MFSSHGPAREVHASNPARLPLDDLFMGRYRVIRCIAHGGMGAVYEVVHTETERPLALKVLLPLVLADGDARSRFAQEARVTARVRSDHIVDVVDAGIDPETDMPFLVMELLEGEDLGAALAKGPFEADEALRLLGQAAVALDRCHEAGIVHRDLKPANVMVTWRDDGTARVKILDFGVAKVLAPGAVSTGTRSVGTTLYMAPEQITGERALSAAADRYAFAQLAFTMLVGKPYFHDEASTLDPFPLLAMVAEGPRESARERAGRQGVRLPAKFDGWFERATHLEPERRHPSAVELVKELAAALRRPVPVFPHESAASGSSDREGGREDDRETVRQTPIARRAPRPRLSRRVAVAVALGLVAVTFAVWLAAGSLLRPSEAADARATGTERGEPGAVSSADRAERADGGGSSGPDALVEQATGSSGPDALVEQATGPSVPMPLVGTSTDSARRENAPESGPARPPVAGTAARAQGRTSRPSAPASGTATSASSAPPVESPW